MPSLRLTSERYLADPALDQLRARAQDLGQAEDWAGLYELRRDLERDAEFWPDMWARCAPWQLGNSVCPTP